MIFVSGQTSSRFGPIHCGQSAAAAHEVVSIVAQRKKLRVMGSSRRFVKN
jgi:hypothetical protein